MCTPISPYLGQGATAIATVISLIENRQQLPLALRAYESSRKERVDQIQAATYRAREQLHLRDGDAQAARDLERKAASNTGQNSDVVKMQHSYWTWDAAGVAEKTLAALIVA